MVRSEYKRTQPGTAMIVVALFALAVEAFVSIGHAFSPITAAVTVLFFMIGIIFSTMTIAISEDSVEWWFTFGLFKQRLALSAIAFAMSEKVTLLNGLGIRTDGKNWLWIVNGSSVVSFDLRDGRKISLGSPEAQNVALLVERMLSERR